MAPAIDTKISTLGECTHLSPLRLNDIEGDNVGNFVSDAERIRYQLEIPANGALDDETFFERAGPRKNIFFDPRQSRAAIVTCGGLCPGLNNVIRSAFLEFYHNYGLREVLGIRYGYKGLTFQGPAPIVLTPGLVEDIHREGGSMLASSRGMQSPEEMVDFLVNREIDMLICVGGDGTQKGSHAIAEEIRKRGLPIAVVGVPKTIDNAIQFVRQTFGYYTAIEEARKVLDCAHCEAKGAINGVGLVKLMGRDSGFIAAGATIASQEVNFAIIPEIPLKLDGPKGFLSQLWRRLSERGHAVVVVAEGAGQDLLGGEGAGTDASGNKLHADIGVYLRDRIKDYFKQKKVETNVKYIDPSYTIRSVAANSHDARICNNYARHAVHAAMAGKTDCIIGDWYSRYVLVPIPEAVKSRKKIDPESDLWQNVISSTGQPLAWE